jgi:microfibrillar-associated protein 1
MPRVTAASSNTDGTNRLQHVKVSRHFAGKANQQQYDDDEDAFSENIINNNQQQQQQSITSTSIPQAQVLDRNAMKLDDSDSDSSSSEDDDDEIDNRRARLRERYLREQALKSSSENNEPVAAVIVQNQDNSKNIEKSEPSKKEFKVTKVVEGVNDKKNIIKKSEVRPAESSDNESSGSEDSDSEEEDEVILKPVFVPKVHRVTIQEEEARIQKEEELQKQKDLLEDQRKQQTKELIRESIQREKEAAKKAQESELEDIPDDNDEINEEEEFEKWRQREFARIRRDREERENEEREIEERERRKNMTEEELIREKQANDQGKEKGKIGFLQKYYHKGVFFMDTDENGQVKEKLYTRDYSAPTLEDKVDKSSLPKVLQVKNFGKSGRSKYTHLKDQDTTDYEAGWAKSDTNHADRPTKKKKY